MTDVGRRVETLAIMMTDVEGSTALRMERGDVVADEILGTHAQILRDQIRSHAGQERQFLGDGFLVSFWSPLDAVRCAISIQRALEEHSAADPDRRIRVRIGIHVGEVTERAGELYGQALHAAARVMAEASGGQVLVSPAVRDVVQPGGTWRFVDSGLFWLKGFPERWRLYEVAWAGASIGRSTTEAPALTALVERDAERANLRRAVDEARGGRGSLVLVAGEAGVGKSRLVAEVAREAEARGMRVLMGHCVESEGAPPYLPYVEMIEEAVSNPRNPEALRNALVGVAPEVARIAPVLRRLVPDIGPPVDLPPELAQRYVWNSVGEFLTRGAQGLPLLLVLEDLQWADESTVLLTEYLAPLLSHLPALLLGTYRDGEVDVSHPLARVISVLARRRLVERIGLPGLSPSGVRTMVEALAGQPVPDQLVRLIEMETEGNPFFIEEVYLHLAESGVLFDEHGRVHQDLSLAENSVPEGVRLVLGERLARLSPATRDALTAAAVLGRVFSPDLVSEVAPAAPDALIEAFDEAEHARLIAPAARHGHLAFSHELIRQTLLADTSTLKRERLHLRAADTIERSYADDIETHAGDLAHHLSLAGSHADPGRLARYLAIAGRRAFDAAAFEDAVVHFQKALALVAPGDQETRPELLEWLALALRSVGRWDDSLRPMNEALDLYQELGSTDGIGRLAWAMVYQLTWSFRVPEAVQIAQRALAALGDVATADRARLICSVGWALSIAGDYESATALFQQGRALAERVGDERAIADVLHLETIHHMGYAEFTEGIEVGLRAAEVFEREGALWDLAGVQAFVVYLDRSLGSHEQSMRLADKTMAIAERLGHLGAIFLLLFDQARDECAAGALDSVDAVGRKIIDVCERGGLPWLYVGHLYIGLAAHWRGDASRAEEEFRRSVELEPRSAFGGHASSTLARHLAHVGRSDEVWSVYQARRSSFPSGNGHSGLGAWNAVLAFAEALYVSGFRDEVVVLSPLVDRTIQVGPEWVAFDGRLRPTRAGLTAAAAGRWNDAERWFGEAEEHARQSHNEMEMADLYRLRAQMLLDRSGPDDAARADELLHRALDDYVRFGMPSYAAVVEGMLAAMPSPAPASHRPSEA
jgi:class 3 adenylate cyclase/tetratricopeptide (TPR) repeat protein